MVETLTSSSGEAAPLAVLAGDDLAKYRGELSGIDITDAQKDELLETLWRIMCSFVDLGFRVDICEQLFAEFNEVAPGSPDGVEWRIPPQLETTTEEVSSQDESE